MAAVNADSTNCHGPLKFYILYSWRKLLAIFAERITRTTHVELTRLGVQGRIQLTMAYAIQFKPSSLYAAYDSEPFVVTRPIAHTKNAHLGPHHPVDVVDDGCAECVLQTARSPVFLLRKHLQSSTAGRMHKPVKLLRPDMLPRAISRSRSLRIATCSSQRRVCSHSN